MKRKHKQKKQQQVQQSPVDKHGFLASACVIVKNEERNLPRWLECMKHVADEIVVVDTGSEDRTVELAEAAGARIFHFKWIDDFAAAKNYAIEQARGRWILFLDADEYFSESDYGKVREALRRYDADPHVVGLMTQWVNIDRDRNNVYMGVAQQIRLFRNLPSIRYRGSIHENLHNTALEKDYRMLNEPSFCIYHTGYSSKVVLQKLQRNLALLLKVQKEHGEQPQDSHYIADCYYGLKQYDKALEYAEKAIQAESRTRGRNNRPHAIRLECLIHLQRDEAEILSALEAAHKKYPDRAEYNTIVGNYYWNRQDYLKAGKYFQEGLELSAKYGQAQMKADSFFWTDESRQVEPFATCRLAILEKWQGHFDKAMDYLLRGLKANRYYVLSLKQMLNLVKDSSTEDLLLMLNALYDKKEDAAFLLPILREAGRATEALYYERQSGKNLLADHERYLLAGKREAAVVTVLEDMDNLTALGIAIKEQLHLPKGTLDVVLPKDYVCMDENSQEQEPQRLQRRVRRLKAWLETMSEQGM